MWDVLWVNRDQAHQNLLFAVQEVAWGRVKNGAIWG